MLFFMICYKLLRYDKKINFGDNKNMLCYFVIVKGYILVEKE